MKRLTNEWNAFVSVSLRLESRSRKVLENTVSSVAHYAFNYFISLEQETLQHSRYIIWQIFT